MIGDVLRTRYELTHLLNEDALFASYAARDRLVGREATVRIFKAPFSQDERFVEAIGSITAGVGAIDSPALERMYGVEEDGGIPFLVTDISRGSSLAERIRKLAPYSVPVSIAMAASVLEGLDALHRSGHFHGDVGSHRIVVLADGTARLQMAGLWQALRVSQTAAQLALPAMAPYMAPEVSAEGEPSARSDVYAVGVILFELLSGRLPYMADSPVAMALKHASSPVPSVRTLNPSVPAALDEAIKRALAKNPAERYEDASSMLRDLRRIEDAVRFGRNAPWPTRAAPVAAATPATASAAATPEKPAKVKEPRRPRERVPKEEREPADVPLWMTLTFVAVLAVLGSLIGMWVFFSDSVPETVEVPRLVGQPSEEARQTLEDIGLEMRVVGRRPSEQIPSGAVIEVEPEPGEPVRKGSFVAVRLSSGSQYVPVPNLKGKTVDEARAILMAANLDLDERVIQSRSSEVPSGRIIRHVPMGDTRAERFTKVRVVVSTGREAAEEPITPPKKYLYTLNIRLAGITDSVQLRVDMTDSNGTRTIYQDRQYPDDEVTVRAEGYGDTATFKVYYDGELVSEVVKEANESDEVEEE